MAGSLIEKLLPLVFILLSAGAAFADPQDKPFFPVSVWYSGGKARAPMLSDLTPESEVIWRKDLQQIKALGFNTVRTWVDWGACEPKEGSYHLENLDLMLKLASELDLKVIVQVYMDSAPDWVGERFPDGRFVAQNGEAIPSQAAPGYCFDHPGVHRVMLEFLKEVARHAAKSKAFYAWDLWSEPHVINWAEINYIPDASFCYCHSSLGRFREWLRAKYGSLEALNKAWYRRFDSWSQVEPPRFDTILSYTDYLDWRVFITQKLAEDLKSRDEAVREIMPNCITTSHAAVPSAFGSFSAGEGNPDDYLMFKSVDYYGTSLYPKHSLPPHWSPQRVMIGCDLTRSAGANQGFYVGELQGGFGVRGDVVSQEITPADLVRYMWTAVSRGARGLNIYAYYPMSSGYESGGYGLIGLDGTITERGRAAGSTAKIINENADFLAKAHPVPNQVAIVVNQLTNLIGGSGHNYNQGAVYRSLAGYYRILSQKNITVDFVDGTHLSPDQVRKYKLVILPYPIMMLSSEASALEEYVREGGHLFTEARPGWVDENGRASETIPGFGWDEMLGVRENFVRPQPQTQLSWDGHELAGAIYEEHLTPSADAKVLATFADGSPAAFEHSYGSGKTIIAGTLIGQANEGAQIKQQANIMQGSLGSGDFGPNPLGDFLASWAGLNVPEIQASSWVDLQQLETGSGRMIFLINWNDQPAKVSLQIPLAHAPRRVAELTRGTTVQTGKTLRIEAEVSPMQELVYRVDY